jgi:hypothetical protein
MMTDSNSIYLEDLCSVLRSKNAGPFLITLDIMFRDSSIYYAIKANNLVTKATIAEAYNISESNVVVLEHIDNLHSIKATLKRHYPSGSPGDADVYGMNQEGPLLGLRFPLSIF